MPAGTSRRLHGARDRGHETLPGGLGARHVVSDRHRNRELLAHGRADRHSRRYAEHGGLLQRSHSQH
jgi:hypothetical protein